ncbi:6-carboxytetrahydropterin synthase QueD [Nocardia takedensis]|uniref:6-carboxytetrahydropterin synthase QueD n=1 Tax=Nocardia takedensis TaxID=259390 RepID=UPI003F759C60
MLFVWNPIGVCVDTARRLRGIVGGGRLERPGVYRICKRFSFEAAHFLRGLPEGHKCARLHGHSYSVEIVLWARELTGPGFVVDFADLKALKTHLDASLDHTTLNDVLDVEPTSENLAKWLYEWCAVGLALPETARVEAVRVSETDTTWAEYRPATFV